jgi:hypothetical protein
MQMLCGRLAGQVRKLSYYFVLKYTEIYQMDHIYIIIYIYIVVFVLIANINKKNLMCSGKKKQPRLLGNILIVLYLFVKQEIRAGLV